MIVVTIIGILWSFELHVEAFCNKVVLILQMHISLDVSALGFHLNVGLDMLPSEFFMSHLDFLLGYSTGEIQALRLIVLAGFGAAIYLGV